MVAKLRCGLPPSGQDGTVTNLLHRSCIYGRACVSIGSEGSHSRFASIHLTWCLTRHDLNAYLLCVGIIWLNAAITPICRRVDRPSWLVSCRCNHIGVC